jgi:molecular chaperone GrpE (heat shock protein)
MNQEKSGNMNESTIGLPSSGTPDPEPSPTSLDSTNHFVPNVLEVSQVAVASRAESPAGELSNINEFQSTTNKAAGSGGESERQLHPASDDEPSVAAQLRELAELFDNKMTYDRFKEKQIEALHSELQEYKRGLTESLVLPLIRQIVRYCDQLPKHIQGLQNKPVEQLGPDRIFKELEGVREDLHLILENFGVTIFHQVQDSFDTKTQLAKQTEPTDDSSAHGKVLERLLPGFEYNGRMIEKERVRVAVYCSDKPSPTN